MDTLTLTLLLAFIVCALALCFVTIGWLITGKVLKGGMCGKVPNRNKKDVEGCSKEFHCDLCNSDPDDNKK